MNMQGLRQTEDDLLYIIHVRRGRNNARWDLGGPLIGDAQSELQGLRYQIMDLQVCALGSLIFSYHMFAVIEPFTIIILKCSLI